MRAKRVDTQSTNSGGEHPVRVPKQCLRIIRIGNRSQKNMHLRVQQSAGAYGANNAESRNKPYVPYGRVEDTLCDLVKSMQDQFGEQRFR